MLKPLAPRVVLDKEATIGGSVWISNLRTELTNMGLSWSFFDDETDVIIHLEGDHWWIVEALPEAATILILAGWEPAHLQDDTP